MTKSELIAVLTDKHHGFEQEEIDVVVNTVLEAIIAELAKGRRVELRGFGSFSTKARRARRGRNPKTGETVMVPAKHMPHFKPGKEMRERVDA